MRYLLWSKAQAIKINVIRSSFNLNPPSPETLISYFFEAHFQVVLRLLLIIRKRFVDQKLLFHMDLENKNTYTLLFLFLTSLILLSGQGGKKKTHQ